MKGLYSYYVRITARKFIPSTEPGREGRFTEFKVYEHGRVKADSPHEARRLMLDDYLARGFQVKKIQAEQK